MLHSLWETEERREKELEELLFDVAQGDPEAMEALYRQTSKSVFGYALSILRSPVDAEDVLHDCFVQVFQKASGYRSAGKPMAWILTIARNLCRDAMRKRRKSPLLSEAEQLDHAAEEKGLTHEERLLLDECMNRLRDEERQIVVLHAVSGFKHQEIADWLQIPLSTVLSKYRRALIKLRTAMLKGEP